MECESCDEEKCWGCEVAQEERCWGRVVKVVKADREKVEVDVSLKNKTYAVFKEESDLL